MKERHTHWCVLIGSKATNQLLLVSGCSVVGWTVVVVSSLSVVGISVLADDNVADPLSDDVKFITFEVLLAVADVIDSMSVAVASVVVRALDENTACVDVSRVNDIEDEANPL